MTRWRRRGLLEAGLAIVACALVAVAVMGSGLAQTVLATPDSLTWLRNLQGELTRVDPESGQATDRLPVAGPGSRLVVTQGDGVLVVTNLDTNEVTVVDASTLRLAGGRKVDGGAKMLLANRQLYLVAKRPGTVERVDTLTAATVGRPWRAGAPITDAAVDERGRIWALTDRGQLADLGYQDNPGAVVEQGRRQLTDTGPDTVLVSHAEGVTAIGPNGLIAQVGTDQERTVHADDLAPPLVAAETSPATLIPVSSPKSSTLRLIRDTGVVSVDTAALGCAVPAQPAVYQNRIYLPCLGARKIVVLDPEGRRAGADLPTAGDAELVLRAGLLIVNVPSAQTGLVVMPDGTVRQIRTHDPRIPVVDPTGRPTRLPTGVAVRPPPQQPSTQRPRPTHGVAGSTTQPTAQSGGNPSGRPTGGPGTPSGRPTGTGGSGNPTPTIPTPRPTSEAPRPADHTPTGVAAQAQPNNVRVSWAPPPIRPSLGYRILRTDTDTEVGTATTNATFTLISSLTPGDTTRFVVVAVEPDASYPSQPSDPVTAQGPPAAPTIGIELTARAPATLTLRITVTVVADGASPVTSYDLTVTASSGRTLITTNGPPTGQSTQVTVAVDCNGTADLCLSGGTVTATAALHNQAGAGPPSSTTAGVNPPPAYTRGQAFMMVSAGGKCVDRDLRLHTCTGAAGQLWVHANTGPLVNQANGQCLAANDDLHFASDGCSEAAKRWNRVNVAGNVSMLENDESGRECVYVTGDVAGEGVRVLDRERCPNGAQDRWYHYRPTGLPMAAAPAATGQTASPRTALVDVSLATLVLIPIVVGALRRSRRLHKGRS